MQPEKIYFRKNPNLLTKQVSQHDVEIKDGGGWCLMRFRGGNFPSEKFQKVLIKVDEIKFKIMMLRNFLNKLN